MEWSKAGVTDKWALRKEPHEVHHFKKIWSFKLKGWGEVGGRESGLVYSSHKGLVNAVSPEERNQFASWHLVTCVCPCVCMTMRSHLTFLSQHFHGLQIYMCSHVHVCTQKHMGPVQTEICAWPACTWAARTVRPAHDNKQVTNFECRWASAWRLLQGVHSGESSPRFSRWHLETPRSLFIRHLRQKRRCGWHSENRGKSEEIKAYMLARVCQSHSALFSLQFSYWLAHVATDAAFMSKNETKCMMLFVSQDFIHHIKYKWQQHLFVLTRTSISDIFLVQLIIMTNWIQQCTQWRTGRRDPTDEKALTEYAHLNWMVTTTKKLLRPANRLLQPADFLQKCSNYQKSPNWHEAFLQYDAAQLHVYSTWPQNLMANKTQNGDSPCCWLALKQEIWGSLFKIMLPLMCFNQVMNYCLCPGVPLPILVCYVWSSVFPIESEMKPSILRRSDFWHSTETATVS